MLVRDRRDDEIELLEPLRVEQNIDLNDLPVRDGERHHREHVAVRRHDGPGGAVHERGSDERVELRVGGRVPGHGSRPAQHERDLRAQHAAIDPQFDIGVEHLKQGIEVAVARSGEERIDDTPLPREVTVRLRRVAQAPAGAAGELLGGRFGAVKGGGDVDERHAKDVVQHKRESLRGE